eukprot:SAG31_NODE_37474_length_304_cov_0.702439_1_plen_61_part_10
MEAKLSTEDRGGVVIIPIPVAADGAPLSITVLDLDAPVGAGRTGRAAAMRSEKICAVCPIW